MTAREGAGSARTAPGSQAASLDHRRGETVPTARSPQHTCFQGPLCGQMTEYLDVMSGWAEDPLSREYGIYPAEPEPDDCAHASCAAIVHAPCEACIYETLADIYQENQ